MTQRPPWQPYEIRDERCPDDQHDWRKTGEYHPTIDPIFVYQCFKCGAYAKGKDGETPAPLPADRTAG